MHEFVYAVRRRPRWSRLIVVSLIAAMAPTLFWIGRSGAGPSGRARPAGSSTFFSMPVGKADAVDGTDIPCTVSPNFTDVPGMAVDFKLGGKKPLPVIAMLQGQWFMPNEGVSIRVRLLIDNVVQSGANDIITVERPSGVSIVDVTSGYNFVSDVLSPGAHTAKLQWHDNGVNFGCIARRTLIVLHK